MDRKSLLTGVAVTLLCCSGFWLVQSASSQGRPLRAPKTSDVESRLAALETQNAQLQKDLNGLKFLFKGLDKGVGTLKTRFETHTHQLKVQNTTWQNLSLSEAKHTARLLYMPKDGLLFTDVPNN